MISWGIKLHVFVSFYLGVEIENIDVNPHAFGVRCQDDAVDKKFFHGDTGSGRADVVWSVNKIATNG
jgi:hypothetical protein